MIRKIDKYAIQVRQDKKQYKNQSVSVCVKEDNHYKAKLLNKSLINDDYILINL